MEYAQKGNLYQYLHNPQNKLPENQEMVNKQIYDNQIDMWCLGVLTYELLYKKSPFQVYQDGKREFSDQNIKNVQFNFDDKINLISQNAKDFISQLLVKNPENRLTTQDIITHKFIINNMGYPTPNKSTMLIEN
ncbi:Protein kinase-like domain [Pseudocohnilembus persalinus]|uniref:Protein kinase-like domain n=1 Tax=Pseudocohnilembus persalinus TaxID=266149 RepID=A0A0V0QL49_PSEPJ|nr:Protein kinase-like domain [Pseudocohnilembus persalinus]|eukprot:KRX03003.1 Protein kinase-like domain [Pseudocohnilembus persalinus]